MSFDEWVRAFCYFLMFPAFVYFGLIAHNRRQFLVGLSYFALGAFFLLLLVGLVLGHYYYPIPALLKVCLLYTSPSPRDRTRSRMPSSA